MVVDLALTTGLRISELAAIQIIHDYCPVIRHQYSDNAAPSPNGRSVAGSGIRMIEDVSLQGKSVAKPVAFQ